MRFFIDILKGVLIGVANIIPGVSGGTIAVSLGIYDRLIFALTDLLHNFRKSLRTLVPIALGCAVGVVAFAYIIEYLLRQFALPTCFAFIGLIFGGIPLLWRNYRTNRQKTSGAAAAHLVLFVAMFAVSALLPMLDASGSAGADSIALPMWLLSGAIAAATMIIPGVSGSMILMILGYYYIVLEQLKSFFDALFALDFATMLHLFLPLFLFGIGVLLGIFGVAKCIRFLFERVPGATYSAILGLVVGAPVAMLYNTGALSDLQLPSGSLRVVVGLVLMVVTFFAVYLPDRRGEKNKKNAPQA